MWISKKKKQQKIAFHHYTHTHIEKMSTAASIITIDKLPDFFPRSVKQCSKPSELFFECLSLKQVKTSDMDTEAGAVGLAACLKEKKNYETCMIRYDPKLKDPRRHRVSC